MRNTPRSLRDRWTRKFRNALHGIQTGIRGQNSFLVHFTAAAAVIVAGLLLHVSLVEWCILILCIIGVLTAELFNSAIESMAKAITHQNHPHLGDSLDIASAAVLVASLGAAVIGAMVFCHRIGILLKWW
jgi:diacylglycerol kinase